MQTKGCTSHAFTHTRLDSRRDGMDAQTHTHTPLPLCMRTAPAGSQSTHVPPIWGRSLARRAYDPRGVLKLLSPRPAGGSCRCVLFSAYPLTVRAMGAHRRHVANMAAKKRITRDRSVCSTCHAFELMPRVLTLRHQSRACGGDPIRRATENRSKDNVLH